MDAAVCRYLAEWSKDFNVDKARYVPSADLLRGTPKVTSAVLSSSSSDGFISTALVSCEFAYESGIKVSYFLTFMLVDNEVAEDPEAILYSVQGEPWFWNDVPFVSAVSGTPFVYAKQKDISELAKTIPESYWCDQLAPGDLCVPVEDSCVLVLPGRASATLSVVTMKKETRDGPGSEVRRRIYEDRMGLGKPARVFYAIRAPWVDVYAFRSQVDGKDCTVLLTDGLSSNSQLVDHAMKSGSAVCELVAYVPVGEDQRFAAVLSALSARIVDALRIPVRESVDSLFVVDGLNCLLMRPILQGHEARFAHSTAGCPVVLRMLMILSDNESTLLRLKGTEELVDLFGSSDLSIIQNTLRKSLV
eukprot:ANDGO_02657.mRNA.1 hypothetical protein